MQRSAESVSWGPLAQVMFGQENAASKGETESMKYDPMEAAAIRHGGKTFRNIIAGVDSSVAEFFAKRGKGRKAIARKSYSQELSRMGRRYVSSSTIKAWNNGGHDPLRKKRKHYLRDGCGYHPHPYVRDIGACAFS